VVIFLQYFQNILSVLVSFTYYVVLLVSVYGLILQKAVSETMVFVLLTCYLLVNDDLLALNFFKF
jgi:hypothetical protein